MTKAGKRLLTAADEMLDIAHGKAEPADIFIPSELDIKAIRKKTNLSQQKFIAAFGFTQEQIRAWEQGRASPVGGVKAYLMMINADPEGVKRILSAASGKAA